MSPSTVAVLGVSRTMRGLRARVDAADGQQVVIRAQPRHAVRIDPAAVGRGQHVRGQEGFLPGDAEVPEHPRAELVQARPGEYAGLAHGVRAVYIPDCAQAPLTPGPFLA